MVPASIGDFVLMSCHGFPGSRKKVSRHVAATALVEGLQNLDQ
jgi:hypothetical protein